MKNKIFFIFLLTCFLSKAQEIILPFSLYNDKYILLKLPFENQKDSLVFYFDTGATTTLLDTKIAEKIGLKSNYKHTVQGTSGKKVYNMVLNQKIYLPNQKTIEGIHFILDDLSRLQNRLGRDFNGIIGNDILKNYLTKIDFQKKQIELYKFDYQLNTSGYTEIPFTFKNNIHIPQFPISITLKNGEKYKGDILFDSGAGLSLLINTPFKEEHKLLEKIGKKIHSTADNLTDKTQLTTALIQKMEIAGFAFENIPIDLASDTDGMSAYKGYLGILGAEIINRFDIILDYSKLKLYLKTNDLHSKPFKIPVSEIRLSRSEEGIIISDVLANSEASKKGLKSGQKIISINKISTNDIEIYCKMLREPNTKAIIKYLDNGKEKVVKLKLKKLL